MRRARPSVQLKTGRLGSDAASLRPYKGARDPSAALRAGPYGRGSGKISQVRRETVDNKYSVPMRRRSIPWRRNASSGSAS